MQIESSDMTPPREGEGGREPDADLMAWLAGTVVFLSLAQVGGWLWSLLSLRIHQASALFILALSAAGAWLIGRSFLPRVRSSAPRADPLPRIPTRLCWIGAWIVFAFLLANAYVKEDLSWDGNVYHLPAIGLWNQAGHIYWIEEPFHSVELMNGYPKGAELFTFLFCKAAGEGSWTNALNLFFLPAGFLGVAALGTLLGASRRAALCAAICYLLVPVNICQSFSTFVDSAYASCVVAVLALLVHSFNRGPTVMGSLATGAGLGLAMGVKSSGLALLVLSLMLFGFRIATAASGVRRQHVFALGVAGLMAFLVGGAWYLRNWIMTGSPLYPAGLTVAGWSVFPGLTVSEVMAEQANTPLLMSGWSGLQKIAYAWMQGLSAYPRSLVGYDARLGGLGWFWLAACVPAIFACAFLLRKGEPARRKRYRVLWLLVGAMFLATPMNWWARYTVWLYGLGLPCLAVAMMQGNKTGVKAWLMVCGVLVGFESAVSLAYATLFTGIPAAQGLAVHRGIASACDWPLFPELAEKFGAALPSGQDIVIGPLAGDNCQLTGNVFMPLGGRRVKAIPENPDRAALSRLKEAGFDYILWDKNWLLPPAMKQSAQIEAEAARFYLLRMNRR